MIQSGTALPLPLGPARWTLADREGALAWIFLLPSVVYIVALVAIPFVLAIGFAFSDVSAGDPSFDWAGFRNFAAAFDDPVLHPSRAARALYPVVRACEHVV